MLVRSSLLRDLGWPEDASSGSISWSRSENDHRSGMIASLTLYPNGEIVMSSLASFNDKQQARFSAHAGAGSDEASVSMPGLSSSHMSLAQAISLFRAHVEAIKAEPSFKKTGPAPRI